ncbi:ORF6N domain-containing protein [bacterium]|nr:ORF6N domain-containing protein [bacterium]MBT3581514.1 ORF6N domain-containing protein [bacterium]MBT4551529.1 ORF6N domain-containing protein [bacterium]MBT5988503.1 ORF6N domain-containing protein [bacterium]MBT7087538.1 ORF6N domain-containing protein [bacterium]
MKDLIPTETIVSKILVIREQKVMLDRDLAGLYGVETKVLNQAVKRNLKRFPLEFMFQLNQAEKRELVTNCDRFQILKHSSSLPYAFTEHGIAMLSSILNSDKAININILIIKAFIALRKAMLNYGKLAEKVDVLEKKYDTQFNVIFEAIEHMFKLEANPKKIGFVRDKN